MEVQAVASSVRSAEPVVSGHEMCLVLWCARRMEPGQHLCRRCSVRLYALAPNAVEAQYDAISRDERREADRLLADSLHLLCTIREPGPVVGRELVEADSLTRAITGFESFYLLIRATGRLHLSCSRMSLMETFEQREKRHQRLALCNYYDRAQIVRGDARRSVRS